MRRSVPALDWAPARLNPDRSRPIHAASADAGPFGPAQRERA
ncbi:hypothetical protein [Lysobacter gummosus]